MNKCLNCGRDTNNKKFCSISCQNKFQNVEKTNRRFGLLKNFTVKCNKCGKDFVVNEREKLYPKKEVYYCSRSCSNSRVWNEKDKIKKSESNKGRKLTKKQVEKISGEKNGNYKNGIYTKGFIKLKKEKLIKVKKEKPIDLRTVDLTCKECGKSFNMPYEKRKRQCCSIHCASVFSGKIGGKISASHQFKIKRSKNEIYFAELCKNHFNKVLTNEPMFNGWDADVIIEDIKTAVLWNGKWHYEKITKKHSVEQVQNREKIKIKEIELKGYKCYIIKDMGKHNKDFVEKEFKKFFNNIIK